MASASTRGRRRSTAHPLHPAPGGPARRRLPGHLPRRLGRLPPHLGGVLVRGRRRRTRGGRRRGGGRHRPDRRRRLPAARWLGFVGLALAVGVPVLALVCWPGGWASAAAPAGRRRSGRGRRGLGPQLPAAGAVRGGHRPGDGAGSGPPGGDGRLGGGSGGARPRRPRSRAGRGPAAGLAPRHAALGLPHRRRRCARGRSRGQHGRDRASRRRTVAGAGRHRRRRPRRRHGRLAGRPGGLLLAGAAAAGAGGRPGRDPHPLVAPRVRRGGGARGQRHRAGRPRGGAAHGPVLDHLRLGSRRQTGAGGGPARGGRHLPRLGAPAPRHPRSRPARPQRTRARLRRPSAGGAPPRRRRSGAVRDRSQSEGAAEHVPSLRRSVLWRSPSPPWCWRSRRCSSAPRRPGRRSTSRWTCCCRSRAAPARRAACRCRWTPPRGREHAARLPLRRLRPAHPAGRHRGHPHRAVAGDRPARRRSAAGRARATTSATG